MGVKIGILFEFEGRVFRLTNAEYTSGQNGGLVGKLYAVVAKTMEELPGDKGPWWTIETSLYPLPDIITEH